MNNKSADQDCVDAQADLCRCCSHMAYIGFLVTWLIRLFLDVANFLASFLFFKTVKCRRKLVYS